MLMNQMMKRWFQAQVASSSEAWSCAKGNFSDFESLPASELTLIEDRVWSVLAGDVPRAQLQPGDLAIWPGRARRPDGPFDVFRRSRREVSFDDFLTLGGRQVRVVDYTWWTIWDSFQIGAVADCGPYVLLFRQNRQNHGPTPLSNVETPGFMPNWLDLYIDTFDLIVGVTATDRTPAVQEATRHVALRVLAGSSIQPVVDNRLHGERMLRDLFSDEQPLDLVVPGGHGFYCNTRVDRLDDDARAMLAAMNATITFTVRLQGVARRPTM